MSLPLSAFTAVPNPQMLAFMAAQSFVMMMQAGEGWQYGKRKQSAMTNEEFNKQSPQSIMQRQMSELKRAIPTIEQSMNNMTPMIRTIVTQYGDFMAEIVKATPDTISAAMGNQTLTGNISTVGSEFSQILKSIIAALKGGTQGSFESQLAYADTGNNSPVQGPPENPFASVTWATSIISTHGQDMEKYNQYDNFQLQALYEVATGPLKTGIRKMLNFRMSPQQQNPNALGITDENSIQVVSFNYRKLKGKRSEDAKITYKGNFRWHLRKLKQIKNAFNTTKGIKRSNFGNILNKYVAQLGLTYNIQFSI